MVGPSVFHGELAMSAGRHVLPRRPGRGTPRRAWRPVATLIALVLGLASLPVFAGAAQADPCVTGNAVACENSKPGSPKSEWEIVGTGSDDISGFTSDISANVGSTVQFKVKSTTAFTMDIYR